MGVWSRVAGYGMMAGGVALMFTPAAAAGPALMAGGGAVLAGDAQKEAAKKAETQLTGAGNQAIATQTAARDQAAAAYAPYTQGGSAAMGALNSYMGLSTPPPGAGTATGPPGPWAAGLGPTGLQTGALPAGTQQALGVRSASPTTTVGTAVPRNPGAATPQTQAAQQTATGYRPLGSLNAGFVQMRAPDGATQWVPRQQAPFYAQRGAVEV